MSTVVHVLKVIIHSFFKNQRLCVPDPTDLIREGVPSFTISNENWKASPMEGRPMCRCLLLFVYFVI